MAIRSAEEWVGSREAGLPLSGHDHSPTRPWSEVLDDLEAIRSLGTEWDGQGAAAPDPALLDGAIALAQALQVEGMRPADFAVAGVTGTVIFEWHDPAGFLEIEVTAPGRAERRWVRKGSSVAESAVLSRRASS